MNEHRLIKLGFLYMLIWCIVTSASHVFIGGIEQDISPITVCFYTFLVSTLFFSVLNLRNWEQLTHKVRINKNEVIMINITTVFCWILFFYPLKYIEPAIVGAILLGTRHIATIPIGKLIYKTQQVFFEDYLSIVLMFIAVSFLIYLCFTGDTAIQTKTSPLVISISILSTIVCGVVLSINTIHAKRLSNAKFTPLDTLTVRFIFLLIITGIWQLLFLHNATTINNHFIISMLISAISLIVIPQFMLQNAINKLEPISISIGTPFMPILTFFLEFVDNRLHPTLGSIIGISSIFLICTHGVLSRYKHEKILVKN